VRWVGGKEGLEGFGASELASQQRGAFLLRSVCSSGKTAARRWLRLYRIPRPSRHPHFAGSATAQKQPRHFVRTSIPAFPPSLRRLA